jgi:hypothetical protein
MCNRHKNNKAESTGNTFGFELADALDRFSFMSSTYRFLQFGSMRNENRSERIRSKSSLVHA